MVVTWGFHKSLRSGLKCRFLSNRVNMCGSLKTHILSPLEVTVAKESVSHECISLQKVVILMHKVVEDVSRLLGGANPTNEVHPLTEVLEILGGTILLGGTKTRPRKIDLLGGTSSPPHLKGAIKSGIVRLLLLPLVLIKLPV